MPITPTCGAGSLSNNKKVWEKEDNKDKGKEQEKLVAKTSSLIQVINLDGNTNQWMAKNKRNQNKGIP